MDELLNLSILRKFVSSHSPNKKPRSKGTTPIVFGYLRTGPNSPNGKLLKILMDSGASQTLLNEKHTTNLPKKSSTKTNWSTAAGVITTTHKCRIQIILPEFNDTKVIEHDVHIFNGDMSLKYDMIIGRDILSAAEIDIKFSDHTICWEDGIIPMKNPDCTPSDSFYIQDSLATEMSMDRIKRILDAKYEKADLTEIVTACTHLNTSEQQALLQLLCKYEDLFDGMLGKWQGTPYNVELKPDASPYHARPFPIPKSLETTVKIEIDRLIKAGVLKKINRSEWAAPTFVIPKKDGTVRFISDFRELNKRIKWKPFHGYKIYY